MLFISFFKQNPPQEIPDRPHKSEQLKKYPSSSCELKHSCVKITPLDFWLTKNTSEPACCKLKQIFRNSTFEEVGTDDPVDERVALVYSKTVLRHSKKKVSFKENDSLETSDYGSENTLRKSSNESNEQKQDEFNDGGQRFNHIKDQYEIVETGFGKQDEWDKRNDYKSKNEDCDSNEQKIYTKQNNYNKQDEYAKLNKNTNQNGISNSANKCNVQSGCKEQVEPNKQDKYDDQDTYDKQDKYNKQEEYNEQNEYNKQNDNKQKIGNINQQQSFKSLHKQNESHKVQDSKDFGTSLSPESSGPDIVVRAVQKNSKELISYSEIKFWSESDYMEVMPNSVVNIKGQHGMFF